MIKTPHYPTYNRASALITFLEGKKVRDFNDMQNTVYSLRGTPQDPVDWENPNEWIEEKLSGVLKEMANSLWTSTNYLINPRYTKGITYFLIGYDLIRESSGNYEITEQGKIFINSNDSDIKRSIDLEEGLIQILLIVSRYQSGRRGKFLDEWREFAKSNSNLGQESVFRDYLRRRLVNLAERGYLIREGNSYTISDSGIQYLKEFDSKITSANISEEVKLAKVIEMFNNLQKEELRNRLSTMNPFQLENVVKELLEVMGYFDVRVTNPTNDGGVDVVGTIKNGISEVKEVIQVKRVSSNIGRPVLDALRGSLHRFHAFKGTIITTGDFSKGTIDAAFEVGAAPITLINGKSLIDLLIENEIGVSKKQIDYFLINDEYFHEGISEIDIDQ